jgi:hypothetical protein
MAKGVEAQLEQIGRVAQARRSSERGGRVDDGNKRCGRFAYSGQILIRHEEHWVFRSGWRPGMARIDAFVRAF